MGGNFLGYLHPYQIIIMEAIKKDVRGEHSANIGLLTEYQINLSVAEGYPGGALVADLLGYRLASVTVSGTGASGTSGTAVIKQSNEISGTLFDLAAPKSVDFSANGTDGAFDIEVSGQYLIIDASSIVFGQVGKLTVRIVGKR
jgi:hypothetical protein